MPIVSQRGASLPSSPIRKLAPLADAAKKEGVKVYHLNIGQPDLPSPRKGLDALRNINRITLEYSPSDGIASLRETLVGYYRKFGAEVSPDEIIVTCGGSEAVLFSFLSCLNPGDEVVMAEPGYANYISFANTAGAKVRTVTSRIENGFALPPVEAFENAITPATRAILLCNPSNPTGYVYTAAELQQIKEIVKKHDLFLFSD